MEDTQVVENIESTSEVQEAPQSQETPQIEQSTDRIQEVTQDNQVDRANNASAEQAKEVQKALWDYKKDKRWGSRWKTENDIIQSYHPLETHLTKLGEEVNKYKGNFKKYGIEPDKFEDYAKEYLELKDPNNPNNARASYLSEWLDNPLYATDVTNFFKEMEKREQMRKYPNMSDEQIKIQQELERRVQDIEKKESERQQEIEKQEFEKQVDSHLGAIQKGMSQVDSYCKKIGLTISQEDKDSLLAECDKNGVDTRFIFGYFLEKKLPEIEKMFTTKAESRTITGIEKNRTGIISSQSKGSAPKSKTSLRDVIANKMYGKSYSDLEQ